MIQFDSNNPNLDELRRAKLIHSNKPQPLIVLALIIISLALIALVDMQC